ncbi:SEC-C metal-binding domain-containing protein [Phocaeicola sartorii]|uniref:SEC-C metal-binding domain-containing protein n=1 Tax=Phocaeicola sartorii TaxID=671267 RepID=UPI00194E4C65|nr:SEC-C metal-binding domain-containing protein [Phocaeicola sartorii]
MKINALTIKAKGLLNAIVTPVTLKNTFDGKYIKTNGIWDTGATNSVITRSSACQLGLVPTGRTIVNGVHGAKEVNSYFINITLNNNNITLDVVVTECEELSSNKDIGMLIGMDIITTGDFSITNYNEHTTMSFRTPSIQTIDFVRGMKEGVNVVKDKIPGRNDPCQCGSGKKYKHCCGNK